jgi:hypothetical protein
MFAVAACPFAWGQAPNGVTLTPSAMTINYQIGAATLPAAQTLAVQTAPKGLNFRTAISGSPFNAAWLLVSANAGTSPATLKVEVNPTGLPPGNYIGTLTFTAVSGPATYNQTATVTLQVASAAAAISANPASLAFTYVTGTPVNVPSLASAFVLASNGAAMPASLSISGAAWLTLTPSGDITLLGLLNTISVTSIPPVSRPRSTREPSRSARRTQPIKP